MHNLVSSFPTLSTNQTWNGLMLDTAQAWRSSVDYAANYTAVRDKRGDVHFIHPCVGSTCESSSDLAKLNPLLQEGGSSSDCIARGTCFAHGMDGDYKDKLASYTNVSRCGAPGLHVC